LGYVVPLTTEKDRIKKESLLKILEHFAHRNLNSFFDVRSYGLQCAFFVFISIFDGPRYVPVVCSDEHSGKLDWIKAWNFLISSVTVSLLKKGSQ
jgi:hypothetical protein